MTNHLAAAENLRMTSEGLLAAIENMKDFLEEQLQTRAQEILDLQPFAETGQATIALHISSVIEAWGRALGIHEA